MRSLGYIVGSYLGDGHISNNKVRLETTSSNFAHENLSLLKQLEIDASLKTYEYPYKKSILYRVAIFKKNKLFYILNQYKNEPNTIKSNDIQFKKGFIEGFFDAEGNISIYKPKDGYLSLSINNTNFNLLQITYGIIKEFGVEAKFQYITFRNYKWYRISIYKQSQITKFEKTFSESLKVKNHYGDI